MKSLKQEKSWNFEIMNFLELTWTFKNSQELSWTFMSSQETLKILNYQELFWTFMNFFFKKSWNHETLQLQGDCAAMEHRRDASLVKSWNLNCSSFYDALLRRWVCSWTLLTEGVAGVTALRSIKPWQRKTERQIWTWTRCLKAKLQVDEVW